MSFPSTPTQLLNAASEARAREVFSEFDQFSTAMQMQAQLLLQLGLKGDLSDFTFREMCHLMLVMWRDLNQDRFHANHLEDGDLGTLVRTAQVDQFINGSIHALHALHQLTDETFQVAEPDGS
jgi:hypothetical protein